MYNGDRWTPDVKTWNCIGTWQVEGLYDDEDLDKLPTQDIFPPFFIQWELVFLSNYTFMFENAR